MSFCSYVSIYFIHHMPSKMSRRSAFGRDALRQQQKYSPQVTVCQLACMIHIYVCLPSWLKITSSDVLQDGVNPYCYRHCSGKNHALLFLHCYFRIKLSETADEMGYYEVKCRQGWFKAFLCPVQK